MTEPLAAILAFTQLSGKRIPCLTKDFFNLTYRNLFRGEVLFSMYSAQGVNVLSIIIVFYVYNMLIGGEGGPVAEQGLS